MPNHHRIQNMRLQIYKRWGKLLYSGQDAEAQWDGRIAHKDLAPSGTYYWTLSYLCQQGEQLIPQKSSSWVSLVNEAQ
ncbi:gliding motility-associated-like protein [Catalinimonas alkaloidigena]|uniref:T9SS type B sorting domain-containing protein n=1 Tax=Catalinimonas alkaloidigena TaxID=1075417 RepID=UPI0024058202|nr:gliding motility-associated C-terminal domain-containing protein [Catalinimonas alkaloidigena]MDF9801268.1 gliding motility-associated-like protein [Catalinimonas alkaloidigena]MDF9801450.1 gliding motility-associated-like protein [Catalinimonas alkaloidigena]